jgi:heterodisulfide reductase subunit A
MVVNPDVLVLGAGVAGLSAALHLAGPGRRVHLVERGPFLGGKTVLYEKVFPGMECGACLVNPWIDRVLHEEKIKVHLTSELEQVKGFFGSFEVGLRRRARGVAPERCVGCGTCQGVCPVRVPNDHLLGLAERPAIYLPFPGAQPAVAVLDRDHCLNRQGQPCETCRDVCPTGAILAAEEDQTLEIKVGAIVLATGFDEENRRSTGEEGRSGRVLSGLETEILLNSSGPSGGRLPWPEGLEAGDVGLIACRSGDKEPSGISSLNPLLGPFLKLACQIRDQLPQAAITIYSNELNLPGGEDLFVFRELVRRSGISWEPLLPGDPLRVGSSAGRDGVEWTDQCGVRRFKEFDLLIAAEPLTGSSGVSEWAGKLRLPLNEYGFWKALGARLEPVNTPAEGLYAVGCARGPRDIPAAVLDGLAAAGQIRSRLVPGERIALEPLSAAVTREHCSGCRICLGDCPFLALEWDPEGESVRVNEILRSGTGAFLGDEILGRDEARAARDLSGAHALAW